MKNRRFQDILIIILVLLLIPYFYISFFSRPMADDWANSYSIYNYIHSNTIGINSILDIFSIAFEHVKNVYFSWQGTFSSIFFFSFQPGIFNEKLYFLGSLFLILLTIFVFIYFYGALSEKKLELKKRIVLSLLTTLFIFGNIPSIVEGLYWFTGTYHYIPFFILTILNLSLMLSFHQNQKDSYLVFGSFISAVISGGNQVTGFLNILILVFIVIYDVYSNNNKKIFIVLFFAIVFFIIMFISPGNFIRKTNYSDQSIIMTMINSAIYGWTYVTEYLNFGLLSFSIFSLIVICIEKKWILSKYRISINPIFVFLASIIIYCGCLCVPYYAMGDFGPPRLQNVIWLIFAFLFVFNLDYLLLYLFKKGILHISLSLNKYIFIVLSLLCISISIQKNYIDMCYNILIGNHRNYAYVYDKNIELIKSSKKTDVVEVEQLPGCSTISVAYFSNDPTGLMNYFCAIYYDVDKIVLKE